MTSLTFPDVIDQLSGIQRGDEADALRNQRPQARLQAQQSYLALFEPAPLPGGEASQFTGAERFAVASFVAALHGHAEVAAFYTSGLLHRGGAPGVREAVALEAAEGLVAGPHGPYGRFPAGPLSQEDLPGPFYAVSPPARAVLGPRLAAALAHAHLLVLHPRDADAAALQALLDAGWSTTDIVTLSQLVAFLSFQIRVIAGLRVLAGRPASSNA